MKKIELICQGDVGLIRAVNGKCLDCGALFERAAAKVRVTGVIAFGESTGHSHAVAELEQADVLDTPSGAWLETHVANAAVVHQEHGAIAVPELGLYHVHTDKVFDYSAQQLRNVAD